MDVRRRGKRDEGSGRTQRVSTSAIISEKKRAEVSSANYAKASVAQQVGHVHGGRSSDSCS